MCICAVAVFTACACSVRLGLGLFQCREGREGREGASLHAVGLQSGLERVGGLALSGVEWVGCKYSQWNSGSVRVVSGLEVFPRAAKVSPGPVAVASDRLGGIDRGIPRACPVG